MATAAVHKRGDTADALGLARLLLGDDNDFVHKGTAGCCATWATSTQALRAFLDEHAAAMPRLTLRAATEKLDKPTRSGCLAAAHPL